MDMSRNSFNNNANSNRQRRPRRSVPAFITTIGWASMLLAVSGVSAFGTTTCNIPVGTTCQRTEYTGFYGISTSSTSRKHAQQSGRSPYRSSRSSKSQMQLHMSTEDNVSSTESNVFTQLWSNVLTRGHPEPTQQESKQEKVDEYLEWLDKRYHRLHDEEKKDAQKPKFSAWNWLTEQENKEVVQGKSSNEDALYVLGVAELASKRLLKKHRLPIRDGPPLSTESGVVIEAIATSTPEFLQTEQPSMVAEKTAVSPVVEAGTAMVNKVVGSRRAILRYQARKLSSFFKFVLNSLAKTPKACAELWKLSGGRKPVTLTLSFAAAFLIIARPIAQAVVRDAADQAVRRA
mmetsp:Transcript_372/g.509  ORF Transcript_372/g.509 Transcript_372/m.509 type:complete len:347 (-) Transcript_372:273-1313(-)